MKHITRSIAVLAAMLVNVSSCCAWQAARHNHVEARRVECEKEKTKDKCVEALKTAHAWKEGCEGCGFQCLQADEIVAGVQQTYDAVIGEIAQRECDEQDNAHACATAANMLMEKAATVGVSAATASRARANFDKACKLATQPDRRREWCRNAERLHGEIVESVADERARRVQLLATESIYIACMKKNCPGDDPQEISTNITPCKAECLSEWRSNVIQVEKKHR